MTLRDLKLCGITDLRVRGPGPKGACQTDQAVQVQPRALGNRPSAGRRHLSRVWEADATMGHAGLQAARDARGGHRPGRLDPGVTGMGSFCRDGGVLIGQ